MVQWDKKEILKTSNSYWRGCTLQAGVRLDVFSLLADEQLSLETIAEKTGTDQRGVESLLNGLAAMGLLHKKGDRYSNTEASLRLLHKDSPESLNHIILHHHNILDGWAQLDEAVRTGRPVETRSYGIEEERENFLMGMFTLAMNIAPLVADKIDLSHSSRLLDLGGGPGTYGIHFCLANPHLKAAVFDRPTTEPFARKTVATYQLQDRIDFYGGDFTVDPLPEDGFDVAWLSHILHSNGPEACQALISQVVRILPKGGKILVHDFFLNDTRDGPEFPALFSLNMLVGTQKGRSYTEKEVRQMLENAGVSQLERLDFQGPNNSSIICATI